MIRRQLLLAPRFARPLYRCYSSIVPPAPLSKDEIVARYKEKLAQVMKEKGASSVDELREHFKDEIVKVREREKIPPPFSIKSTSSESDPSSSSPSSTVSSSSSTPSQSSPAPPNIPKVPKAKKIKNLSSFVDVEKLAQHTEKKEIELIWRARFANKPNALCAVLTVEAFNKIRSNARRYPMFILPLPRDATSGLHAVENPDGASEMQFVQWTFPEKDTVHCLLTSLLEYKLHTEFARPHTTLIFHADLAESHDLVLLNGTVEPDMNISSADAQFLVICLQKFYNLDPRTETDRYAREKALRRLLLLELFHKGEGFNISDLINETQMAD
ncbi:ATP11 protein-domain-containing protein [Myxozyma melibiosi]|uniref:ATP11 protein-domain-containing protein n=1 Tax=Myxozyma melibiosi TaxID=54550 RepID=A0ABR1FB63_9ASCO